MVFSLALWASLAVVPAPPAEEPLPASIDLRWNAPAGCSSAEAIQRRIEALLSGPPRGDGEALVVAEVAAAPGGVHMTLTTTFAGSTDVREVSSASCDALAEATAVLLAVSLEPGLEEDVPAVPAPAVPEPEPEPEPQEPSPASIAAPSLPDAEPAPEPTTPEVSARPVPPSRAAPRRPLRLHGVGAVGAEWGALAEATVALRLGLGIGQAGWSAALFGTYLAPRRRPEALVQAGTVGVRGCWTPGGERWRALLCGGGEIGGFRVESRDLAPPRTLLGPYAGPGASLGVAWTRGRAALFLRTEAVVRAWGSQTRRNGDVLTTQEPVSLRLLVGARFTLFEG